MRRHFSWAMAVAAVFVPLLALLGMAGPAAAEPTIFTNTNFPKDVNCPAGTYGVPYGTRYVEIVAIGGPGGDGGSGGLGVAQPGGKGGSGAKVTAIFPVTSGQTFYAVVGRTGDRLGFSGASGWPNGGLAAGTGGQGGGSTYVSTQNDCKDGAVTIDRSKVLVLAGGGGGGGDAGGFGSGGNGGNAGARSDLGGDAGDAAYHLDSDCDYGRGGGGAAQSGAGYYGVGGCMTIGNGKVGHDFVGGASDWFTGGGSLAGGGGGGWYGGGSGGPSGGNLGAGGGGAGASYVAPTQYPVSTAAGTSLTPSVAITAVATPTTTATFSGTTNGANWYTSAPTITLSAAAGTYAVGTTYYALDKPACSAANLVACTSYSAPFTIASGAHTLTYFNIDAKGLDEEVKTTTFVVTPTTSAGVTAASIGTGTNPTATARGTAGSISVSGTGSGVVGAAVYGTNPAGAPVFNSSGTYVDVIAGSGLSSLTFKDCALNGGTDVYWWNGTAWARVSNQSYDQGTKCVTVTVNNTTIPTLSQLTGTVIAAGSPPTTTAIATTADGKPYTAGTWTNQSVTIAFTCTANATPSVRVTRATDGQNQSASGTCTDGLGQATTTTFGGINVDKTPPSCAVAVTPTVIWTPNGKPVAITGTVTAGDNLSGLATVVGGAITSNEILAAGDVRGFAINTPYATPLKLGAVVNVAGTLVATRAGDGSGRTYTQRVTVTDQAGNTNTAPCTWTVTVPRDQR